MSLGARLGSGGRLARFLQVLALLCLAGRLLGAQERELYWKSLEVRARVDADGRLHVSETHTMVFTGEWNGGERSFRLEGAQRLRLRAVTRVDPSGATRPLIEGDLTQVDNYAFTDARTLRWRSRLSSDPPFDKTPLTYRLDYELSNVLEPRDGQYVLDHDFGFPSRPGAIARFALTLDLDPVWSHQGSFEGSLAREELPPGQGVVVTLPLRYGGRGQPGAVRHGAAAPLRFALLGGLAAAFLFSWTSLLRSVKSKGLLDPLPSNSGIDEKWLAKTVFAHRAEVIGAAWDDRTSATEVAAVLARMQQEGRLASEVREKGIPLLRRPILHMKLLVDRNTLHGYEAKLIDALFFRGDTTDTESIRSHYRRRGFDPISKIKAPVEKLAQSAGYQRLSGGDKPSRWPTLALFLVAVVLLGVGAAGSPEDLPAVVTVSAVMMALYGIGLLVASPMRRSVTGLPGRLVPVLILTLSLGGASAWLTSSERLRTSGLVLTGFVMLCAALWRSILNAVRTRDSVERIRFRRDLAAARGFFEEELKRPQPRLQDSWFPYLVAFGLGPKVDRWFRSFGGQDLSHSAAFRGSSSGGYSGSSSPTGWTGGGGSFGGAGASAAWTAAAASLAAGVASPSSGGSSGSSRGGGSGGGSSGGGGGGGW